MTTYAEPVDQAATDCGHTLVLTVGEIQHHDIPDDGAPHTAAADCGCGPQRYLIAGQAVYEHADQDLC